MTQLVYPRMLFRGPNDEETLVVSDEAAQAAAETQGWAAKPLPPADAVENPGAVVLVFPRMVFRTVGSNEEARVVSDEAALEAATADGFAPRPLPHELNAPPVVPTAPAPLFESLDALTAKDAEPVIDACTSVETLNGWLAKEGRKGVRELLTARLEALAKG